MTNRSTQERARTLCLEPESWRDYAGDGCIHELFEAQVERAPQDIAAVCEDAGLTYGELNSRANQIAHYLKKKGVGSEILVGLYLERSLELVVAMLGVLKAGAAYLPLDTVYPRERIANILDDSRAGVVLTQTALLRALPKCSAEVIALDGDRKLIARERDDNPVNDLAGSNLAYVIFTSGSMGRPKGVQISHSSMATLFRDTRSVLNLNQKDIWTIAHSCAFDLSVWELWGCLLHGGRLVIVPRNVAQSPREFYELLCRERVTVLSQTPSAARELVSLYREPGALRDRWSIRLVICGGESLPQELASELTAWDVPIWNFYGPTETTVWATLKKVQSTEPHAHTVPIGRPLAHTRVHILDSRLRPVQDGEAGELHIGGSGLARGYLRRPDLTAESFIPNLYGDESGSRLYKTGDLCRYLPNGDIEFLGRMDHQVKIRGFRIELGEIEAALRRHASVRDAVVQARQDAAQANRLVAYVVPREDPAPLTSELRNFLKEKLPEYMVPSAFAFLDSLPLTSNGKVDRKALPELDRTRPALENIFVAPRTPVEKTLAGIWAEVLGLERVGVEDNFFDLGGHSLSATRIITRVRDVFETELPIRSVFENATVGRMARTIEEDRHVEPNSQPSLIEAIQRDAILPLSFSQERVWFIQQLEPANVAYNFQATLRFTGQLDIAALEQSLSEIVQRHEIYRTTFPSAHGRPAQIVHHARPVRLPVVDLRALAQSKHEAAVKQVIEDEGRRSFDLTRLPLIRWTLLQLSEQEHVLVHVEHHLVHDGWSFNVFLHELLALYKALSAGKPSPLPELPVQFADFAVWQRQWMQGEVAETQLAYWKKQLAGSSPVIELPSDRPRPVVQTFRGAAPRFELPLDLCASLRALSRRERTTLFVTMLAAFVTLLHRYSGQDDICVGTGMANRRWRETEGLIGMIINNIVLRTDLSGDPTVRQLLARVRETTLQGCAHQDLPFDKIVEALQPARNPSYNPLFQVMFGFHDAPMPDLDIPGLTLDLGVVLSNSSAKFDLSIIVIPHSEQRLGLRSGTKADGLTVIWEYNTELFDDSTIARMAGHFKTLLESIVADPDQHISDIALLTKAERHQLLVEWNDTKKGYPAEKCIHELFEEQVEKTPDTAAVLYEEQQLTYRELNQHAERLAHYLRKLGVGPESLVGICMERSLELVVGLLGILKAGGAYVPLDPEHPKDRLGLILEDTPAKVLLTQGHLVADLPNHSARVICLDRDWEEISKQHAENHQSKATADNLAYAIFTSGSTGDPKGVAITHRAFCNHMHWLQTAFPLTSTDRVLQKSPVSFDASVWEFYAPLFAGGTLILAPPGVHRDSGDLIRLIRGLGITTVQVVPSLLRVLVEQEEFTSCRTLKRVFCGGEELTVDLRERLLSQLDAELINLYGPAETTIDATYCICEPGQGGTSVPLGRPIFNTQCHILDSNLHPVPIGATGELYIGGDGLARGYLNRPDLTADRFVPDPFSGEPGQRLYKTGDLARYLPDGNIEFLGRIDYQVKIRGSRIELGETEGVLCAHPQVLEAVVVARADNPGEERLVAYVVSDDPVETSALRNFLKKKLPEYMIPSAFVFLDSLPLTLNGKVDRNALPAPDRTRPDLEKAFVAPRTPVEETLAGIWVEILKLDKVGIHDNFFNLGGHSLLATQIVARLRAAFRVELPLRILFEHPTVASLAERIDILLWAGERHQPSVSDKSKGRDEIKL